MSHTTILRILVINTEVVNVELPLDASRASCANLRPLVRIFQGKTRNDDSDLLTCSDGALP